MASSFEVGGPPGKRMSFIVCVFVVCLLALQPDFGQASLFLASWGLMYFVAGASLILMFIMLIGVVGVGLFSYNNSEHFARRIDGFLNPDIDPRTQLGYATNAIQEGGFFGVGLGEGSVKMVITRCSYRFYYCGGGRRVWFNISSRDYITICCNHGKVSP